MITLEDGILDGGFGEKIARFYGDSDMKVSNLGLKKEFLDRYDAGEVLRANGLTRSRSRILLRSSQSNTGYSPEIFRAVFM